MGDVATLTDEDYMRMALEEARTAAEEGEVPIGAVVVCGGERVPLPLPSNPTEGPASGAATSPCGDSTLEAAATPATGHDASSGGGDWGLKGGEVVSRSHNRRETEHDPSAHAEFAALVAASQALGRWRLTGCTVYVTLEPCLMCAGLMVNARIDRCVFGAADPKGGALGTLYDVSHDVRLNHEFEVVGGVLADECAEELRRFFRARRAAARA